DLEPLARELSNILGWIEQLNEVDTTGVEPMTSVVRMELARRPDVVTDGNCRDKILANAPEVAQGFFAVPKVVEQCPNLPISPWRTLSPGWRRARSPHAS